LVGGINLYVYVQNDPVNLIDPRGLLRLNYKNITETQKDNFIKALEILEEKAKSNDSMKKYFNKFKVDIQTTITSCDEGPDVYIGGGSEEYNGSYYGLTNNITISTHRLNDTPTAIADTLIHEIGHWSNDVATPFGTLNPDISDVPKFVNPKPSDGPYGYAAEMVTFGKLYAR
jgi:uncharacterized protein RhaS with RHS repeats